MLTAKVLQWKMLFHDLTESETVQLECQNQTPKIAKECGNLHFVYTLFCTPTGRFNAPKGLVIHDNLHCTNPEMGW